MKIKALFLSIICLFIGGCSNVELDKRELTLNCPSIDIEETANLEYHEYEDGYSVSMGEAKYTNKIIIPATYNNKNVIRIEKEGFKNSVFSVMHLPNTIKSIGENAFENCTNELVINFPKSIETFEKDAIKDLHGSALIFEDEAPKDTWNIFLDPFNFIAWGCVDYGTFDKCIYGIKEESLVFVKQIVVHEELSLPSVLKYKNKLLPLSELNNRALQFPSGSPLKTIYLCRNIKRIGEDAFKGLHDFESVYIPRNIIYIEKNAFKDCPKLVIRCESTRKLEGWSDEWNPDNNKVIWSAIS